MPIAINATSVPIAVTTSSARAAYPISSCNGVRVGNLATVMIYLKSGNASVVATTADQFVLPNETVIFQRDPNDTHLAAITATGASLTTFSMCQAVDV